MSHVRQQIREAVKTRLDTLDNLNVYTNRVSDLLAIDLPTAVILTEDETSELAEFDDDLMRETEVVIVGTLNAESETIDDELDDWAVKIEGALDVTLGGLVKLFVLTSTNTDFRSDEEGEHWFAFLIMTYTARHFTLDAETMA